VDDLSRRHEIAWRTAVALAVTVHKRTVILYTLIMNGRQWKSHCNTIKKDPDRLTREPSTAPRDHAMYAPGTPRVLSRASDEERRRAKYRVE